MKALYKNLFCTVSGALLCLVLALPANARITGGGGGGGGGKPSGGGGGGGSSVSSSRPSGGGGGGGVSVSRPSGGGGGVSHPGGGGSISHPGGGGGVSRPGGGISRPGVGVSRPSFGMVQRNGSSMQRNPVYVNRQGVVVRGANPYINRQGVAARGNYGYPQRVGIAPGRGTYGVNSYRTSPRIGYGRTAGYWGSHGYYHYNHGYYRTHYGPRLGYRCRILPYGYYPFFWGDYQYYYSDGLYYTYDNDEYTVVEPPIGAEVTSLCDDAQSIVINGQQYYECNGVYYQPVTKDDGTVVYMVAGKDGQLNTGTDVQDDQPQGPQLGDIVTQLPPDCRKIKVNGEKLYVSPDGVYYQELIDASGNKTYKVVGLPSDEPDQN